MIDSRGVVQEVQKELLAAVQRGHEQVRKSQEQVRKSREAVTDAVSELAKSVRPNIPVVRIPTPTEVRAHAQEFANHAMAVRRDVAGKARHAAEPYAERANAARRDLAERARQAVPYAERFVTAQRDLVERARHAGIGEQVAAAQRTLAAKVTEVAKAATPFVAEGRTRLTQVVGARQPASAANGARKAETTAVTEPTAKETVAPATVAAEAAPKTAQAKARTAKAGTGKTRSAKAASAKPGTSRATAVGKPRTPKK